MIRSTLVRLLRGRPTDDRHPAGMPLGLVVLIALMLLLTAVLAISARAESVGPAEAVGPVDPPARVGRLADIQGVVSFRAAGQDQWSAAALNYPVTSGDAVWTEPDARAVVEIGPAAIRMGGGTELDAAQIDLHVAQLQLAQGSANIRLAVLPEGDSYEVGTPRGTVSLLEPGLYRIDAGAADQPTRVTAFRGAAAFAGGGSSLTVESGQAVDISGEERLGYAVHPAEEDEFDRWAAARDERPAAARAAPAQGGRVEPVPGQATQYVSPEATGYQDLDRYGAWATTPDYGAVWYPTAVPAGWAPYRYGHWAWVAPWGWTWIDDAPWGFTPFHYGRWVFIGDRWAWVPGVPVAEPVYAPALVTFIGGPDWSVVVADEAVPAIGWIPLAPEEVFIPFFDCSPTFIRQVNITNVNEVVINQVINKQVINQNVTVNNTVATKPVNLIGGVPTLANGQAVSANKQANLIGGVPNLANGQAVSANKQANPIGGVPGFANGQTVLANQHAVTVVAHKDFVAGRPVAKAALGVTPAALKTAPVAAASGPASLPHPVTTGTAAAQPAPRPHAAPLLGAAAHVPHGLAPTQAVRPNASHPLSATAPEQARAAATLPNAGASAAARTVQQTGAAASGAPVPRVIRGDVVTSAPGPHPVPAVVPSRPAPPAREAHGVQATAQPHSVQPGVQPHSMQRVVQPHPAQSIPQPRPAQSIPQPRAIPSAVPLGQQAPVPVPTPAGTHASAPQPHSMPKLATLPPQPRSAPQPVAPNRSFSAPPATHVERAAPPVSHAMPSAPAPQPHSARQVATLPLQPHSASQPVAPVRSFPPIPAQVPRAAPQLAHAMPSAPAPQPHIAAPATRMTAPQSQGRPQPAHGQDSQAPRRGDQTN